MFVKKRTLSPKQIELKQKKMEKRQQIVDLMNRYSLLLHILLACGDCFLIEWISRHSFLDACSFVADRNLVFLYNSLIVFSSLLLVYLSRRRTVLRVMISAFWVFLGTINGCVLAKRVSPFSYTDLKMVGDLFTMQSNYFTMTEAVLVIVGVVLVVLGLVVLWFKGPKYMGKTRRFAGVVMISVVVMMLPRVTNAAVSNNILTSYFENLAQGYKDYGFVYSFSASVLDRGMSAPEEYSEEAIASVLARMNGASLEEQSVSQTASGSGDESSEKPVSECKAEKATKLAAELNKNNQSIPEEDNEFPNIICVLLESFVDPATIQFLETDMDPVPNFHYLQEHFSTGYLEVPVVGAGTANTEFEVLTGMGMHFFGLGEYPYKTILKQTNCESIASDLRELGYGSHVVHDNGANFYSRRNAFSQMGFDSFTSKEMMDIQEYTPLGTWPTDDVMLDYVQRSLDYTPNQQDFVYIITVETHGDYPKYEVITNPAVQVTGVEEEGMAYAWEYYVNQVHEMDDFIGELLKMLAVRDEKTLVVFFGDHLPTMGLTEEDMTTGSLFKTNYITWNNFGMERTEKDLRSYQLLAEVLNSLDIHQGTMFQYHQNRQKYEEEEYQKGLELLQYDILYGEHYVYDGGNPYPATDLMMGIADVRLDRIRAGGTYYYLFGDQFTKWSKVYVDGEKISTTFLSSNVLRVKKSNIKSGTHKICVNQMGSSDTILRSSNELTYLVPEEAD